MTFNNEKCKFMAIKTSPKKGNIQLNFIMKTNDGNQTHRLN